MTKARTKTGTDPRRKPNQKVKAKRTAAAKPQAKPHPRGKTPGAVADAWVLRSAPGLARTLQDELRADLHPAKIERVDLLWQRNHDLLFLPTLPRAPKPHELRTAEDVLHCLVYGRFKITESQLDRLAAHLKGQRRRLIVTVDGDHFNRFDLLRFVARELGQRGVKLDDNAAQPLLVFCVEQAYYVCVPLRDADQTRGRDARRAEREGSLPPTIAAAMAFLTGPRNSDTILDPVCGSGTLLAEAAAYAPGAELHGLDSDPRAVKVARRNLSNHTTAQIEEGDARQVPLDDGQVTLALANLPFGKQFGDPAENRTLYIEILQELRRVAAPDGFRAAVMAGDRDLLQAAAKQAGFRVELAIQVRTRGEPATILLLRPTN